MHPLDVAQEDLSLAKQLNKAGFAFRVGLLVGARVVGL